jgi:hypothetical protein
MKMKRRKFIKTSFAAGAAIAMPGTLVEPAAQTPKGAPQFVAEAGRRYLMLPNKA